MKTVNFRIPTSIKDIRTLINERSDRRYNHNVQVVNNFYRDIINAAKKTNKGFKETNEIRECLIRAKKTIE